MTVRIAIVAVAIAGCASAPAPTAQPLENVAPVEPAPPAATASAPIEPALDRTMISAGVQAVVPAVRACGTRFGGISGRVKVHVSVAPEGFVNSVTVSDTPDPGLGACVANVMRRARFTPTIGGGVFAYPFIF